MEVASDGQDTFLHPRGSSRYGARPSPGWRNGSSHAAQVRAAVRGVGRTDQIRRRPTADRFRFERFRRRPTALLAPRAQRRSRSSAPQRTRPGIRVAHECQLLRRFALDRHRHLRGAALRVQRRRVGRSKIGFIAEDTDQSANSAMTSITETELARDTRRILDRVGSGAESFDIVRHQTTVARLVPAQRTMTAAQALADLRPMSTPHDAAAWAKDARSGFGQTVRDPSE